MDKYALKLHGSLEVLSDEQKLLFGFWISKRLFHNYVYFNKETSFGDIDVMLDAFNLIEKYLGSGSFDRATVIKAMDKVEMNTPDTEDYSTILVSFALDACSALNECLAFILDKKINRVIDIGIFARDTVDMFIQELNEMELGNPNFESEIQSNELMRREMTSQEIFLNRLKKGEVNLTDITFDKIIDPSLA